MPARLLILCLLLAAAPASAGPLDRRAGAIELDAVPLADVVDYVRDVTGLGVVVEWRALAAAGIDRDTPVSLTLTGASARDVLRLALRQAGDDLTFYADDGVVRVTTAAEADRRLVTRTYDVRDLLLVVPDFAPGDTDLGGGDEAGAAERGRELVGLIRATIRPEIWAENGGPASVRYFRGTLVVTAPRSVHARL